MPSRKTPGWIVACLLETETDQSDYEELPIWKLGDHPDGDYSYYAIQTPWKVPAHPSKFHNDVLIPARATEPEIIVAVEKRMNQLANDRDYPPLLFSLRPGECI